MKWLGQMGKEEKQGVPGRSCTVNITKPQNSTVLPEKH